MYFDLLKALIRSRVQSQTEMFLLKALYFFIRAQHCLSYYLIYVPILTELDRVVFANILFLEFGFSFFKSCLIWENADLSVTAMY